jgi:hypothetical protein
MLKTKAVVIDYSARRKILHEAMKCYQQQQKPTASTQCDTQQIAESGSECLPILILSLTQPLKVLY